jgi:ribosome-associated toxin RatA of RatAB toxin-antitoxin module
MNTFPDFLPNMKLMAVRKENPAGKQTMIVFLKMTFSETGTTVVGLTPSQRIVQFRLDDFLFTVHHSLVRER